MARFGGELYFRFRDRTEEDILLRDAALEEESLAAAARSVFRAALRAGLLDCGDRNGVTSEEIARCRAGAGEEL